MSDKKEHITNLTPELIKQYLEGSLTPRVQHQVERYLLDHPFESEAMEGFESTELASLENDLTDLKSKLTSNNKQTKVIPIWQQYWKVAAVITILIISTFLILEVNRTTDLTANELALNDDKSDEKTDEIVELDTQSDQDSHEVSTEESDQVTLKEDQVNILEQEEQLQMTTVDKEEISEQYESTVETEPIEEDALDEEVVTSKEQTTLSVKDESDVSNAVSGAARTSMSKSSLSSDTQALNEVVATKEEEKLSKSARQSVSKKRKSDKNGTAYPIGGSEAYQNYLKSSLQYPQKAIDDKISGIVIIEFTVTKEGMLEMFEVIKGLGSGCDEEAIRLIKEGPKWESATKQGKVIDEKVRLEVIFNR